MKLVTKLRGFVDSASRFNFFQKNIRSFSNEQLKKIYKGKYNNIKSTKSEKLIARTELLRRGLLSLKNPNVYGIKVKKTNKPKVSRTRKELNDIQNIYTNRPIFGSSSIKRTAPRKSKYLWEL